MFLIFRAVQSASITEKLTMKNTENVSELPPRMTRELLIDSARKASPLLPPAYRGIMIELANRLDYTSVALCEAMAQRKELAVQNATLREDVASWAKECDRIVERHTKIRTNMHLLEAQRELRELSTVVISQNSEVAL
ncbi:hypothetical protein R3J08_003979 [Enterobacter hormaechei]|nr:hypothetical protein [Enterobacter hormaechei]